jgi:hypothetical protein
MAEHENHGAPAARVPQAYVTSEGVVRLPPHALERLHLDDGRGIVFLAADPRGVRIVSDRDYLDELFPAARGDECPAALVAGLPTPDDIAAGIGAFYGWRDTERSDVANAIRIDRWRERQAVIVALRARADDADREQARWDPVEDASIRAGLASAASALRAFADLAALGLATDGPLPEQAQPDPLYRWSGPSVEALQRPGPEQAATYRLAQPADVPALAALQRACFPGDIWDTEAEIARVILEDVAFVAEIEGRVVGTGSAQMRGAALHICAIEVEPRARRARIGTGILRRLLSHGHGLRVTARAVTEAGRRLCETVGLVAMGTLMERAPIVGYTRVAGAYVPELATRGPSSVPVQLPLPGMVREAARLPEPWGALASAHHALHEMFMLLDDLRRGPAVLGTPDLDRVAVLVGKAHSAAHRAQAQAEPAAVTPEPELPGGDTPPRIFCASKTRHAGLWRKLRKEGAPICCSWIDRDELPAAARGENAGENYAHIERRDAQIGERWARDLGELREATALIVFWDTETDGPLVETLALAGAALVRGLPVWWVTVAADYGASGRRPYHPSPRYSIERHPGVRRVATIEQAIREAGEHTPPALSASDLVWLLGLERAALLASKLSRERLVDEVRELRARLARAKPEAGPA